MYFILNFVGNKVIVILILVWLNRKYRKYELVLEIVLIRVFRSFLVQDVLLLEITLKTN